MDSAQSITLILREFATGDKSALDRLMPLIYSELHKVANNHLRRLHGNLTLQPTALVHEAYVRMLERDQPDYQSRAHFFGIAAHLMRQILIDHARARTAAKRGGGAFSITLDEARDVAVNRAPSLIAVDDALQALEQRDPVRAKIVEMRFFGGLTAEESAAVLDLPVEKVRSHLRVAQAWLYRELSAGPKKSSK